MRKLEKAQTIAVIGGQWGDEGKGKIVDFLSSDCDIVARAGGGANAGHTIIANGKKFVFHLVPSGILHEDTVCVIGNGCVVHLPTLLDEMEILREAGIEPKGRIYLSDRAHLLFEHHIQADRMQEQNRGKKIGTTCRGIGPAYEDKISRRGIRAGELMGDSGLFGEKLRRNIEWRMKRHGFEMDIETEINLYRDLADEFDGIIIDSVVLLHQALQQGKRVLIEGAQGGHLDIDFGTYPYVTSSNTSSSGACSGTGIPPSKLDFVLGIIKAYTTRVGEGPFPSEIHGEEGDSLREKGSEYGATTGRPRRCGWFDAVVARHAMCTSGVDAWNLTKLDVLTGVKTLKIVADYLLDGKKLECFPANVADLERIQIEMIEFPGWEEDLSNCRKFEDLPQNAQNYCREIEKLTGTPIHSIGVGPSREDLIICE